jgi:hypothetical protein
MERYKNASTAEKAIFALTGKFLKDLTHINERNRELTGDKSWVKYKFNLKPNNPHIHAMEFGVKKGEIANIRFVVAKGTHKIDFWKKMEKLGFKGLYGNIVLSLNLDEKSTPTLLAKVDKLVDEAEVVALDPKRTYCDPPAGWVKDLTGKEGIVKEEPATEE